MQIVPFALKNMTAMIHDNNDAQEGFIVVERPKKQATIEA